MFPRRVPVATEASEKVRVLGSGSRETYWVRCSFRALVRLHIQPSVWCAFPLSSLMACRYLARFVARPAKPCLICLGQRLGNPKPCVGSAVGETVRIGFSTLNKKLRACRQLGGHFSAYCTSREIEVTLSLVWRHLYLSKRCRWLREQRLRLGASAQYTQRTRWPTRSGRTSQS